MATYSFLRDLFELNMGQFHARYGGPISGEDFNRMKALAAQQSHSIILIGASATADGETTYGLTAYIITRLVVQVYGTNADITVTNVSLDGSYINVNLSTVAGHRSSMDMYGMECSWTSLTIVEGSGSPDFHIEIYGYTPPTTNP